MTPEIKEMLRTSLIITAIVPGVFVYWLSFDIIIDYYNGSLWEGSLDILLILLGAWISLFLFFVLLYLYNTKKKKKSHRAAMAEIDFY
jgi:O-antigen/teichoic acid export membrane protein